MLNCTPKVRHKTFGVQFSFDTTPYKYIVFKDYAIP